MQPSSIVHHVAPPSRRTTFQPKSGTSPQCEICGRPASGSFTVSRYTLYVCNACDYVFIDPLAAAAITADAIFDDAYFIGGGAGYINYIDEAELLRAHGRRYGRLLTGVGAQRVLDVGAAAGFILRGLLDAGCDGIGIEPNATMAAYAAGTLALDVRGTTLEACDFAETFDAVVMLQVVDHLEDLRRSFARVQALTRPGGWCLIEFGNRASVTARLLGPAWHEYAPPSVQRVFSLRALRVLLADFGFDLHATGHPAKYLRADHALSLLKYKAGTPLPQAILDRVARAIPSGVKMRYIGDDIMWALFSKRGARILEGVA